MERTKAELTFVLNEALRIIDGLADQQAYTDDWYLKPTERLRKILRELDENDGKL